ncbi:hypothetical protein H5410_004758 [Solanum commersonii]|uniref:Uncharacterized protein n=1 Tax=Solanum commersonii TaxID=4109 RepID=A0A9J6A5R6_SOLCO|nr:hypothetical protein H5410_004758 [Solanum commersonii]
MVEAKNLLLERMKFISSPTTISDLKEEINNLKEDIHRLKEKNIIIEVKFDNIDSLKDLGNNSESSLSLEGESNNLDFMRNLYLKNDKKDILQSLKTLMSQKMDPPWVTKGRGKGNNPRGRGRSSPGSSSGSSYESSSNSPILQRGKMSLIRSKISQNMASSSVHLEDILEDSPLYADLWAYLSQKQKGDSFASIAKDDIDDIKLYKKVAKKEIIFLSENSKIQRKEEPWKIFQCYLINSLYFLGESYKTRSYYETILISTGCVEFQNWGISSMKERKISLNKVPTSFTYWDYINAFNKVLYYNNERHKHTWFIKVCAKIFVEPIPNWFLNWWSYHGPTTKILSDPFLKLYKEWVKIHKWTPEIGFTKEQIPCLYWTYYKKNWEKLMKKDPKTKALYGQELLDSITQQNQDYSTNPYNGGIADNSVKHIDKRIFLQDGNKQEMINEYLDEVRRNLLLNITHYEKSDTSMRSEMSDEAQDDTPQPCGDTLQQTEDFLFELKGKDAIHKWTPKVDFTKEQIPCLYRTYYNNFWDKLIKKNPKTKALYGQEFLDSITQQIQDYSTNLYKGGIVDNFVKHIAKRISIQDGNKQEMINEYLDEVRRNLLLNIIHYEKSDTSMRSETSDKAQDDTPQPYGDTLQIGEFDEDPYNDPRDDLPLPRRII